MLNIYLAITFSKLEAHKLYFCRKLASSACEKHSRYIHQTWSLFARLLIALLIHHENELTLQALIRLIILSAMICFLIENRLEVIIFSQQSNVNNREVVVKRKFI